MLEGPLKPRGSWEPLVSIHASFRFSRGNIRKSLTMGAESAASIPSPPAPARPQPMVRRRAGHPRSPLSKALAAVADISLQATLEGEGA